MSVLSSLQGAVLACAVLWKLYHLIRTPRDRALRAVVACLGLAALVYPIDVATDADHYGPFPPPLAEALRNTLELGVVYCILVFFLYVAYPPAGASRRARWQLVPLFVTAAAALTLAALVPRGTPGHAYREPLVAASFLVSNCYMLYVFVAVTVTARRCARSASSTVRHGVAIISTSLTGAVVALVGLMAVLAVPLVGGAVPPAFAAAAGAGALVATVGFLVGVCYPGATMRLRAVRVWLGHLRDIHHLSLLWRTLGEAFPHYALDRRGADRWWQGWSLRGVHHRRERRQMECRDGLVDLSPYLAAAGATADPERNGSIGPDDVARYLRPALHRRAAGHDAGATPIGVALPSAPGLDADVRELVLVSRALRRSTAREST